MTHDPIQLVLARLTEHGCNPRQNGAGWQARSPLREDRNPSLSISVGDDGRALLYDHGDPRTSGEQVVALCEALGLSVNDLFPGNGNGQSNGVAKKQGRRFVEAYPYVDEEGELLSEVVRFDPKDFRQRRPDGNGGHIHDTHGVRRVLYRLPELIAADPYEWIFICEGEKDVDLLRSLGLIATTNPGGSGKWSGVDDSVLYDRRVVIVPDNDKSGRAHEQDVASRLHGKAAEVRVLNLPGLPEKGDVAWFVEDRRYDAKDGAAIRRELIDLVDITPPWSPPVEVLSTLAQDPSAAPLAWWPFPLDALPLAIRNFITEGAAATGVDPAMYVMPILAVCGAAIGTTRRVQIKRKWCEPAVIWTVAIARSGRVKSPPFDEAMEPLKRREASDLSDHEDVLLEHQRELARFDVESRNWKNKGNEEAEDPPLKPAAPTTPRRITADTTVEALAVMLSENRRGMLVYRDELSGWLLGFNAYRSGRGGDIAYWLEMYRAGMLLVDRKGDRQSIHCEHAGVCITGTIQPGMLKRTLTPEYFASGLAARLLMAMPPPRPKKWSDAETSEETDLVYDHIINRLLSLEHHEDGDGRLAPINATMTPEARRRFIKFYNEHGELQDNTPDDDLASAYAKLEGYAARFALIFHYVRWADEDHSLVGDDLVDERDIEAGIAVAQWFIHETERVYGIFAEGEEDTEARELCDWILQKGGDVSPRELQQHSRKHNTSDKAHAALEELVERERGEWYYTTPSPKGGKPSKRFRLSGSAYVDNTPPGGSASGGSVNVDTKGGGR